VNDLFNEDSSCWSRLTSQKFNNYYYDKLLFTTNGGNSKYNKIHNKIILLIIMIIIIIIITILLLYYYIILLLLLLLLVVVVVSLVVIVVAVGYECKGTKSRGASSDSRCNPVTRHGAMPASTCLRCDDDVTAIIPSSHHHHHHHHRLHGGPRRVLADMTCCLTAPSSAAHTACRSLINSSRCMQSPINKHCTGV